MVFFEAFVFFVVNCFPGRDQPVLAPNSTTKGAKSTKNWAVQRVHPTPFRSGYAAYPPPNRTRESGDDPRRNFHSECAGRPSQRIPTAPVDESQPRLLEYQRRNLKNKAQSRRQIEITSGRCGKSLKSFTFAYNNSIPTRRNTIDTKFNTKFPVSVIK